MATLLELENEVLEAIGRPGDATAKAYAKRSLNAGITLAGLLYEPPELRTNGTLIATNAQDYVDMSTLTRLMRVEAIWNSTGGDVVWSLPFDRLNVFNLPTTGNVKYYALHGNTLYYKPTPTGNETLDIHFLQYAARLENDEDAYPFTMHEDFVLSIGAEITFGFLEEGEMLESWNAISERLGVPAQTAAQIRQALREEVDIGDIQRARE
jgi:hypothetical protein